MFADLDELRDFLSDIQISFIELDPTGERVVIGLIESFREGVGSDRQRPLPDSHFTSSR